MQKGNFYPKGVVNTENGVQFVWRVPESAGTAELVLYSGKTELKRIPVPDEYRIGQMYCVVLEEEQIPKGADSYRYYAGGRPIEDHYAESVIGYEAYGRKKEEIRYGLPEKDYDWETDKRPGHSYGRSVIYGLHVRGFTRHASSGVRKKGTFAGIREKLPYLKDLGITAIELMPAYEFDEWETDGEEGRKESREARKERINYWGYKEGYYYTPKSGYAHGKSAASEFKDMVKALHRAGIEVIMQFYFPQTKERSELLELLRHWVLEYHVDGFHLFGDGLPVRLLASDPFLMDTKLIYDGSFPQGIYEEKENPTARNLAVYQNGFLYDMRKALKGDADSMGALLYHVKGSGGKTAEIHAIAGWDGFTLWDLVSYDQKHNEENGENNEDGNDYNCSWNCGVEGKTRKKAVLSLRKNQVRSALALVLLSQGTPYIQSGDEFGQTQRGNNNPYCQDNEVTWLNWNLVRTNRDLYEYTKRLIGLRREHAVFHREEPLKCMDYLGCGYPDVSFHGDEAWKPALDRTSYHLGVMYGGKYVRNDDGQEGDSIYAAYNMHWEPHSFALPKLPKGMAWRLILDSSDPENGAGTEEGGGPESFPEKTQGGVRIEAKARSIRLYQAKKEA